MEEEMRSDSSFLPGKFCQRWLLLFTLGILAFFTFTCAALAAPIVTERTPAAGATEVPLASTISAIFSEPMDLATITPGSFTLSQPVRIKAIAAGYNYTMALRDNGTVTGWGYNGNGETRVPAGLGSVINIATGSNHSLALKNDGTVAAWGENTWGQSTVPAGLTGVNAVAAGASFSLALKSDGTAVAWGDNSWGQTTVPGGLANVTGIAAGSSHALALKSDGTVAAWGYNNAGQVTVPPGLSGVIAVAAGSTHSVALKGDGTVVAWGDNSSGQTAVPAGLSGVIAVSAGYNSTLALKNDGTLVAWGDNSYGQSSIPAGLSGTVAIAAGFYHVIALKNDGTVVGWGDNSCGQTTLPAGLSGVAAASAGNSHTVALKSDGTVTAWGDNGDGQTVVPAGLSGVTAVSAGLAHTLVLKDDGTVGAWGRNSSGQATVPDNLAGVTAVVAANDYSVALKNDGTVVAWGLNSDGQTSVPAGLSGVTRIAAGTAHTVALKSDGTVVAWGSNYFNASSVPLGLSGVTAIAAGGFHTLALKNDGTVVAWGENTLGQSTVPPGLSGVLAVAAGKSHSVTLKSDGTVVAWGVNDLGQCAVPAGLSGIIGIAAGSSFTVAVKKDGTLVGWGDNKIGQSAAPQDVYSQPIETSISYSTGSDTAQLSPVSLLPPATILTATVNRGARSIDGTPPSADDSWSFTTASVTPVTTAYPPGGTYSTAQNVTLTANEPATIYYTTNGSDPTTSSPVYSGPIRVVLSTILKFFARDTAGNSETPQTATYTIAADTTPPVTTASPSGGTYTAVQNVILTANEPATIYYTTNGSTPTTTSQVYSGPIPIPATTTLKFFARDVAGNSETVKTATYTLNLDTTPPVTTASPPGGTYSSAQSVSLAANEPATIYYTTNGSDPTISSPVYSGPIQVLVSTILKFFGRDIAGNNETVKSAAYNIKQNQTITFAPLPAKIYGDPSFILGATANSGLPVSYTSSNTSVAIVSGTTVTIVGAGTTTITASQSGNANYNPASEVTQTLAVNKATLTVRAADATREYGVANPVFGATYNGFVNGDTASVVTGSPLLSSVATSASPAGSYPVTVAAGSLAAANYSFSLVNGTLTVTKAGQTITFGALPIKTFGDSFFILGATASSGLPVSCTSSNTAVATVSGTTVTIVGAGTTMITVSQSGNANYNPALAVTQELTVNKATLTVRAADTTRVYGVVNPVFSVIYSGFINGDSQAVLSGSPELTTDAAITSPVGTYPVAVTSGTLVAANYSFSFVNGTLSITRADQSITFAALPVKTYGNASFTLGATASSGLAISYTSSNPSVATVNGSTVTIVGAGSAVITASQGGDDNYNAAPEAAQPLTVNKAPAVVTLGGLSTTYDGAPKAATATTTPAGLNVTFTYNGLATAPTAVASYTVVGTVNDPNYQGSATGTLSIAKGNQTITFGTLPVKTYGDPAFTLTATASSGLPVTFASSNTAVATVSGSTVTIVGAGTAVITASQIGDANYNAAPAVAQTLTVNKAVATITFGLLSFVYDGNPRPITVTTIPAGLAVVVTYDGSTTVPIEVGRYAVGVTVNDANYQGTATATEEITKKSQTITFGPLPVKTYGDAPFTFTADASSNLNLAFEYDPTIATITKQGQKYLLTIVGAGTTVITATQSGNRNYSDAPPVSQTLTVNKAAATVGLGSLSATYDGTPKSATATTNPSGMAVTFTYNGSGAPPTAAGSYTVIGAINNPNYQGSAAGTLSIAKANQSITFAPLPAKSYDNAPFSPGASAASGLAISYTSSNPAVATISGTTVNIVGIGTTIITATQGGDGNYNAATAVPQTLTVAKGNQTISFGALPTKTFGDAQFTLGASSTSGLTISYTSSNPAVATLNGATVTIVGVGTTTITATQGGDGNYNSAAAVPQTLTVGKGNATVTLGSLNATYNGTPRAATATTSPAGLQVTLTYNGLANVPTAAGSYTVVATVNDPNYQGSAIGTLAISKVDQSINFGALSLKTVGDAPFTLSAYSTSGLAISYTSSNPAVATISGSTITIVGAGITTITASQGGDGSYNAATPVGQLLTVNPAQSVTGKTAVTIGTSTSYYDTLTAVLAAIVPGSSATVRLQAMTFAETVNVNISGATVSFAGGYDSGFTSTAGMSTIQGSLVITAGTLVADKLVIM